MYSIHNKGKSVIVERFIRTLKNKIYFDVLDDIINKYNNTVHRTIKMKPVDVKDNAHVDSMELHSKKEVMIKIQNLKLMIM